MQKPVNVIYVNSHDTGRFIQPMGYYIDTPVLQGLAEEGTLFRNCHAAAPTCSPSRAALVTGMYPHSVGQIGLSHRGFVITHPEYHIARHLASHGYHTAAWGMPDNHTGGGDQVGYQQQLGKEHAAVIDFIDGTHEQPVFLSISHNLTHRVGPGFTTDPDHQRYDPRYLAVPPCLPDTPETRADWAHFCSDASALDRHIGEVLDALDRNGLTDNTLIIATTDHGVPFPFYKCSLTQQGTGVFLIMRGPGGFSGGQVVDQMVSHLDLFPTICAVAGIDIPSRLHGTDLIPSLDPDNAPIHDELFAEVTYHAAYEAKRAVRTATHLYERRFHDRLQPVLPNCDKSPTKSLLMDAGWPAQIEVREALYDTRLDPQERTNLIDSPAHAELADSMRQRLAAWMERTDDPLLAGQVPLPEGAFTNDPGGIHPSLQAGATPS